MKVSAVQHLYDMLKPVQQSMFTQVYSKKSRKSVIHCARRLGKTYLLCVISLITAINKSNAQIRYASVTQKAVRKMILPIFKELHGTLPSQFQGKFNSQEGAFTYPNGSMIHIAGVNNGHSDDLRGTAADLCVVDEASFIDDLSYLIESVLMPQLLTVPNSKLILASSSPLSPAHEFTSYIQRSRTDKSYYAYDIYSGGYDTDLITEFCSEAGGANSTTWRREYLNELIVDTEMSIIPEWKTSYVHPSIKDEYNNYYHRYESMDIGVRDKTVVLFGYYDFRAAKLVIDDEFAISGMDTTTKAIAEGIKARRTKEPYRAVADNNNLLLLNDLATFHNLYYYPTNKDSLPAMINEVRLLVDAGRLQVDPKCTQLAGCLEFGVYQDKKRKEFGRAEVYGHYDALAALVYMIRNLDQTTNPIPKTHNHNDNVYNPNDYEENPLLTVFNIKERR